MIEVLAALLLLGITLPVIMEGITLSSSAGNMAKRISDAGGLAESKMNELVATGEWQNSSLSGDFGDDHPGYTWTAELLQWGQGQGVNGSNIVQELDVHVSWQNMGTHEPVTISTLVYQSASSVSGTSSSGGS